jgi:hypothetical protein
LSRCGTEHGRIRNCATSWSAHSACWIAGDVPEGDALLPADGGEPKSEAVAGYQVDRLGVAHSGRHQVEGLAPQRMLQTVPDEARHVLANVNRQLADLRQDLQHPVDVDQVGLLGLDHLHEGRLHALLLGLTAGHRRVTGALISHAAKTRARSLALKGRGRDPLRAKLYRLSVPGQH